MNLLHTEYAKIKKTDIFSENLAQLGHILFKIHSKRSFNFVDTSSRTA